MTVLTADGRHLTVHTSIIYVNTAYNVLTGLLQGKLQGCDQTTNLILSSTIERLFEPLHSLKPTQSVSHGLYIIRGDNVAVCGLVDEEVEKEIVWEDVRAEALSGVKHS